MENDESAVIDLKCESADRKKQVLKTIAMFISASIALFIFEFFYVSLPVIPVFTVFILTKIYNSSGDDRLISTVIFCILAMLLYGVNAGYWIYNKDPIYMIVIEIVNVLGFFAAMVHHVIATYAKRRKGK